MFYTFKRTTFLALASFALLLFVNACSDALQATTDDQKTKQIGETAKLQEAGRLSYAYNNGNSIEVKVLNIQDSRCPEDVVCIWEGEARVEFQLANFKRVFYLCLGSNNATCHDTAEFTHEGKDFVIRLVDVIPYPNTKKPYESKVAVFVIVQI